MIQVILTKPMSRDTTSFKFSTLSSAMNFADDKLNRLVDIIERVDGEWISLLG